MVFLCQNNMFGEHTPLRGYTLTERLSDRAAAYGMRGVTVDGTSPEALWPALDEAVGKARAGEGPTFVEALTYRLLGHTFGSDQSYQPAAELARAREAEPVKAFRARIVTLGLADDEALESIDKEIAVEVEEAFEFARSSPPPGADELLVDVFGRWEDVPV